MFHEAQDTNQESSLSNQEVVIPVAILIVMVYNKYMNKKYYFLAGIHRSGNTVLSAILNQHPDIYSSPLNPLCEYMWLIHSSQHEVTAISDSSYRKNNLLSKIIDIYYEDVEKPIIIDREKNWLHPANMKMIDLYMPENPKIIYTVRPIAEILASLIAIKKDMLIDAMNIFWDYDKDISLNDNLCEFLILSSSSEISRNLQAIESIKDPKNKNKIHIVNYHSLLDHPQETMNDIYKFLDIDSFNHNFNNIQSIEKYNDKKLGLPKNLHKIRKKLSVGSVKVDDYVSQYIKEKYSYIDDAFKNR